MNIFVLCAALSMGVVLVSARPEGEASPVANPASVPEETAAVPKPVEEAPVEEESSRPKRWYYYGPGYGHNFGDPNYPYNDMVHPGSFGTPLVPSPGSFGTPLVPSPGSFGTPLVPSPGPTGRTRYAPTHPNNPANPTFNDLVNHQRRNEQLWQHRQWQQDQIYKQQNLPDVIDTAAVGSVPFNNQGFNTQNNRPFNTQGFNTQNNRPFNNQEFNTYNNRPFNNQDFNNFDNNAAFNNERFNNFNNRPINNPRFNNEFDNRPPVIDTQISESRTRFGPTMRQQPQTGIYAHQQNRQAWNNPNLYPQPYF